MIVYEMALPSTADCVELIPCQRKLACVHDSDECDGAMCYSCFPEEAVNSPEDQQPREARLKRQGVRLEWEFKSSAIVATRPAALEVISGRDGPRKKMPSELDPS
jgi:hypothetical protein